jgi:hypothetical protein
MREQKEQGFKSLRESSKSSPLELSGLRKDSGLSRRGRGFIAPASVYSARIVLQRETQISKERPGPPT